MSLYPSRIDTDASLPVSIDNSTEYTADVVNNLRSAILAIERAVGLSPQGSANSLADRLDSALNQDGTLKSAALQGSGLISLPVTNLQIGGSAAIEETKLDLDVATQVLQDQISSNDVDIAFLQQGLASLLAKYTLHVAGTYDRHNSTHINHTLVDGYNSGPGVTSGSSLDYLGGRIEAHRVSQVTREHYASAVSFDPGAVVDGIPEIIISNNVQGALEDVEYEIHNQVRIHNDGSHSDGVIPDGYSVENDQLGSADAALQLTRYQPSSGSDIIKIGLCNAASIKSKGLDLNGITAASNTFRFSFKSGGPGFATTVTNLHTAAYPVGNAKVTLSGVVDVLNAAAAAAHSPVSFFETPDGELLVQGNLARDDFDITISSSTSAAFGFTEVANSAISRVGTHSFIIDGIRYTELRTIIEGTATQGSLSNVVDLGVSTTGMHASSLIHIYNHTTNSAKGTYQVTSITGPTEIQLSVALAAGTYSFIVYGDSFDSTAITSDRRVLDLLVDSSRSPVLVERAVVVYGGIEGVRIVGISPDFPYTSGSYTLATSGSGRTLSITDGTTTGVGTYFEPGYIGYTRVWAPDNINWMTALVFSTSPSNGTDTIVISDGYNSDGALQLGTTHHNGLSDIEIPIRQTPVGGVGASALSTGFFDEFYSRDVADFHSNGVVRGFDIISNTTSVLKIRGGVGFINGKRVEKSTLSTTLDVAILGNGTYNVVVRDSGVLTFFLESDAASSAAYSVSDILRHDSLLLIAQFTIVANAITSVSDARMFINDIESKIQLTVDDRELGAGSFRTFGAALLHSKFAPNDTKPEIIVLSDLVVTGDLLVDSPARIRCYGDLSVTGNLTVTGGGILTTEGTLTVDGDTSILTYGQLVTVGSGTFTGIVTMEDNSYLTLGANNYYFTQINLQGQDVYISGSSSLTSRSFVSFDGTADGIVGSVQTLRISDLTLSMTTSTFDIFDCSSVDNCIIDNCFFSQNSVLSEAQLAVTTRCGINLSVATNVRVSRCEFNNLGAGLRVRAGASSIFITDCIFDRFGIGISGESTASDVLISNNIFTNTHIGCILTRSDWTMSNNIFRGQLNAYPTSNPYVLASSSAANNVAFVGNSVSDFDSDGPINLVTSGNQALFSTNSIYDCVARGVSYLMQLGDRAVVSNNTIVNCDGAIIACRFNSIVQGNVVSEVGASSTLRKFIISSGVVSGNDMIFASGGYMDFYAANVVGNSFTIGRVRVLSASRFTGNYIVAGDAGAVYGIDFSGTADVQSTFSGNHITSAANNGSSSAGVRFGGPVVASGNFINCSGNGNSAVRCAHTAGSSQLSGNVIKSGSSYGIRISASNTSVVGNTVSGAVIVGDIIATTGTSNVLISSNFVRGTGGTRAGHADSAPTSVFVNSNKGASERRAFSSFSGHTAGTWTAGVNGMVSAAANGELIRISLSGLDVGASLDSVSVYLINSGATGDITARLMMRNASSSTETPISSTVSAINGYQDLFVPPTSTTYIQSGFEYFVVVATTSAAVPATVSQVTANITI